jgi:hydroxymethylglutaryl-CoA reductase (NADPH)
LSAVALLNSVDQPHLWCDRYICRAIRDLAAIHAACYDTQQGRLPATIARFDAPAIVDAMELWQQLCLHAMPFFEQCGSEALCARIRSLITTARRWMPEYAEQPMTLVHNDCNPRNMAFRLASREAATCLYDWELCSIAPAQRDLAEFLCFTLGSDISADEARRYIDLHRRELSAQSGRTIDARVWLEGFRLALADFMLRRISVYAMLHGYVRQNYLPRVVRSWQNLDRHLT